MRNREHFYSEVNRPGYWCWAKTGNGKDVKVFSKGECYHFNELEREEQEKALKWIKANIEPRQTPLEGHTSYGMKHVLEHRTNIYMTNNQFKEAMLRCGFYPVKVDELNWHFCISKVSPIFVRQRDGIHGLALPECVMRMRRVPVNRGFH